jgi:uncharacterized protein (DUF736 family)
MSKYDNNLTGVLFRNDRKESDKHPQYKGSCEINGVEYWINSWMNESSKGVKYMSLKFSPKEEQQRQQRQNLKRSAQQAQIDHGDDLDDDIPF